MRNDRELLELAAKADGREIDPVDAAHDPEEWECWNPLEDDGDALRLAVKLRLTIKHDDPDAGVAGISSNQSGAPTLDGNGPVFCKEWHRDSDPCAATRRAIVRAAAAIGKAMK